jgi:glutamate dehydrogenase
MTDEVAALVLRNNYEQTLCLGLAVSRCGEDLDYQQRLIRGLESRELLDRAVESLPDDNQLAERRSEGRGLTRPELAVLLAYAKITLFDDILRTNLTDDAYLGRELINYFPAPMCERFAPAIAEHRLRREIIATMLANSILNRGGSTMVQRLHDETGAGVAEIVAAFALARDTYDIEALLDEIDALDNKVANRVQTALYVDIQNLIRRQTVWFLRHAGQGSGLEPVVARFRDGIGVLDRVLDSVLTEDLAAGLAERTAELAGSGVPKKLARRLAALPILRHGTDIVLVADATGRSVEQVARAFFRLGGVLGTDQLLERAETTPAPGYYDRLALNRVVEGITAAQRRLTTEALSTVNGKDPVGKWLDGHASAIDRARTAVGELAESGTLTLSKLSVASAYMHDLADA